MAIALVEKILTSQDKKDEKMLLHELHTILVQSQTPPTASTATTATAAHQPLRNSDLMAKHCKQLSRSLPSEMVLEFNAEDVFPLLTQQRTSISVLFDYNTAKIGQFLAWVFQRKYGQSEKAGEVVINLECSYGNIVSGMNSESELRHLCENFIVWFENHDHLSYNLLLGYRTSIRSSFDAPLVRKQILLSVFRWLRNLSHKCVVLPSKCYAVLQDIALLGLTDVWSAIRKETTSRLGLLLDMLMLEQLKQLFKSLIDICHSGRCCWQEEKTWQSMEGAVRGIYKFLTCCKWVGGTTSTASREHELTSSPSLLIRIGKTNFPSLPEFIVDHLESVVFKLFAHQQLTVRELAGKAFSAFLNKSEYSYFIESFEKVVQHLGRYVVQQEDSPPKLMNPYEAEGFMNAVLFLIKNVPLVYLLCKWDEYWNIFSHYLAHPASTVRQAASLLFKYLVSKDLTSTLLLKLSVQSLCMAWNTDISKLTQPRSDKQQLQQQQNPKVSREESRGSVSWEWCEGRLFAYELVLKFLLTNHLYFSMSKVNDEPAVTRGHYRGGGHRKISTSVNEHRIGLRGRKSFESLENLKRGRKSLTRSLTLSTVSSTELSQPGSREKNCTIEEYIQGDSLITMATHEQIVQGTILCASIPTLNLTPLPEISVEELLDEQAKQYAAEQTMTRWLSNQDLCSFKTLLRQMLIQTVDCLHNDRWELRRMAQQLLPLVCDVIRHVDNSILQDFYNTSIDYLDSFLYNGFALCLLYSIKTLVKSKQAAERGSPSKVMRRITITAEEAGKEITSNLTEIITALSENVSKSCLGETVDISVQILISYQVYFSNDVSTKVANVDNVVCGYIQKLYNDPASSTESNIGTRIPCSKERLDFLYEVQSCLFEYCDSTPEKLTIDMVPTLLQSCGCGTSSLDVTTLLSCVETILQRVRDNFTNTSDIANVLRKICNEACSLLNINNKDFHIQQVRQLLNIFSSLQVLMTDDFPIEAVLEISKSRLECVTLHGIEKAEDPELPCDKSKPKKEMRSGDRRLSVSLTYSTSSRESSRISDNSDSGDDVEKEEEEEEDEEESDWDWSSGEEDEKTSEDGTELHLLFSCFIDQLSGRTTT